MINFNFSSEETKEKFKEKMEKKDIGPQRHLYFLEGNLSSSKSTTLCEIEKVINESSIDIYKKNITFVPEPVKIWQSITDEKGVSLLENFYKDKNKFAYLFQSEVFVTRINAINDIKTRIALVDRSPFADKACFADMLIKDGYFTKMETEIYNTWYQNLLGKFVNDTNIKNIFYLKAEPEICLERIKKRARKGEIIIELDYLKKLHERYENLMVELPKKYKISVTEINSNYEIYSTKWNEEMNKIYSTIINNEFK